MNKITLAILLICFLGDAQAQTECLKVLPDTTKRNCSRMLEGRCNPQFLGLVKLYEESREYANIFCDSLGGKITFINERGEEVDLRVRTFRHEVLSGAYNMRDVCKDDLSESSWYCLDREVITVTFRLSGYEEQFIYKIYPAPQMRHPSPEKIGDYVDISYTYGDPFSTSLDGRKLHRDFYAVIDIGTQDYGEFSNQEYKRKWKIAGEKFAYVTTSLPTRSRSKKFQFFIAKQIGIVGFIDEQGDTWRIKYVESLTGEEQ